jgi:hypothetical protein
MTLQSLTLRRHNSSGRWKLDARGNLATVQKVEAKPSEAINGYPLDVQECRPSGLWGALLEESQERYTVTSPSLTLRATTKCTELHIAAARRLRR